ncbi:MAG: zinc-binding protein [Proteobacteria bacterium]|nr:zinc-binding protein [Pseudomonadota bacterium]
MNPANQSLDRRVFPELRELLFLCSHLDGLARVETLTTLDHQGHSFPLLAIHFGPRDPQTPVLALFGGVHGLERIGTRVVTAYLQTIMELGRWDRSTQDMVRSTRLLLIPLVNPVGMFLKRRANGNSVDLMRNAPVEAEGLAAWHLFGGHRLSPRLPWYRGVEGAPLEAEVQAVCEFVRREIFPSRLAVAVDVHSGYGKVDRFWFPYAKTREPFAAVAEAMALKQLLDRAYAHHVYRMEPQSLEYLAHGDLWDYLYDEYRTVQPDGCFIPFTLELGSWLWVKKNWRQFFSRLGMFNPHLPHRERRTLRRHVFLFDFLYRAVRSSEAWADLDQERRSRLEKHGLEYWYGRH